MFGSDICDFWPGTLKSPCRTHSSLFCPYAQGILGSTGQSLKMEAISIAALPDGELPGPMEDFLGAGNTLCCIKLLSFGDACLFWLSIQGFKSNVISSETCHHSKALYPTTISLCPNHFMFPVVIFFPVIFLFISLHKYMLSKQDVYILLIMIF